MSRKPTEPTDPRTEAADFDDTMRRLMGMPAGRAKEIIKKTAPGKPKAVRERKPRRRAK